MTTGEFQARTSDEMVDHIGQVLDEVAETTRIDVGLFAPDMDELTPDEVDEILQRDTLPTTKVRPLGRVTLQNIEDGSPFVSNGYPQPEIPGGYGR